MKQLEHIIEELKPYQNNLEFMEWLNQWSWLNKKRLKRELQIEGAASNPTI